jgi:glucokinase
MIVAAQLEPMKTWTKQDVLKICLGVDIGGSGLRIRVSNVLSDTEHVDLEHVRAKSTAEVIAILNELAAHIDSVCGDFLCLGAALAVAGPITDNRVILTNWPGDAYERTIVVSELPQRLCPSATTVLLNDLEAGAYGVLAASEQNILDTVFEQQFSNVAPRGRIVSDRRTAVLAMGSGFGVALIIKSGLLDVPLVLGTELGHVQIPLNCDSHPDYELEHDLIQHVSNHYYGGSQSPEYEDIASGRGLQLAYQYFALQEKKETVPLDSIDPGVVAANAARGDRISRLALTWHYKLFMRSAKSIATSLCCDSVVLALDNQVKNAWFIREISDILKDEFYDFIRPSWMESLRVYAQVQLLNFNILGTDYMAHRLSKK